MPERNVGKAHRGGIFTEYRTRKGMRENSASKRRSPNEKKYRETSTKREGNKRGKGRKEQIP